MSEKPLLPGHGDVFDDSDITPLIPAATVIPLRDTPSGVEVLMLHKNSKVAFGGMWVFPGGRIDPEDYGDLDDEFAAARTAAVREALEEADLVVDPSTVVPFSHWTPPESSFAPKRFSTWFFACRAPSGVDGEVTIDGGEIHDHDWVEPSEMLRRRDVGEIDLAPPTIITLLELATYGDVEDALGCCGQREPFRYLTRPAAVDDAIILLWGGDAGYDTGDALAQGPRHRLYMSETPWRYERVDC